MKLTDFNILQRVFCWSLHSGGLVGVPGDQVTTWQQTMSVASWLSGHGKVRMANLWAIPRDPETNIAGWIIHHFDGIYQERWDFHGRTVSFREGYVYAKCEDNVYVIFA